MIHSETSLKRALCPRKWELHKIHKVRSAVKKLYFSDGTALHSGLATWHGLQSSGLPGAQRAAAQAYREDLEYDELWEIEKPLVDARASYCQDVMEAYSRRYPSEDFTVLQTEAPFVLPVFEDCTFCQTPFPGEFFRGMFSETCPDCGCEMEWYVGIIDMIVRRNWNQTLGIVDHKVSGSTSPTMHRWVPHSPQLFTYAWAASIIMQEPVQYTMGNYITTLKKIDKQGDPFHRSKWYKIGDFEMVQHLRERQNLIWTLSQSEQYPRRTDVCNSYGLCSMWEICHPYRPFTGKLDDTLLGMYDIVEENFEQDILRAQQEANATEE